jgi:hypothetical protein
MSVHPVSFSDRVEQCLSYIEYLGESCDNYKPDHPGLVFPGSIYSWTIDIHQFVEESLSAARLPTDLGLEALIWFKDENRFEPLGNRRVAIDDNQIIGLETHHEVVFAMIPYEVSLGWFLEHALLTEDEKVRLAIEVTLLMAGS